MSDARVRELERRWRETGAVDDEAAFLMERVRVGDLPKEGLELAAYCGHEASQAVTSSRGPSEDTSSRPSWLEEMVRGLQTWGKTAWVRAAIAASHCALTDSWADNYAEEEPGQAIALAEAWAECPCAPHAAKAEAHATRIRSVAEWQVGDDTANVARAAAWEGLESLNAAVRTVRFAVRSIAKRKDERRTRAARKMVHTAIRVEVAAWALGHKVRP